MVELLSRHDPHLLRLPCEDGSVLVAPGLQGRIFCEIGGRLIHRLDAETLAHPSAVEFNNLGGNSLWPAPEGGDLAWNYGPGSDEWRVQPAVNIAPYQVEAPLPPVTIAKEMELVNRRGQVARVRASREISVIDTPGNPSSYGLQGVAYRCHDTFEPLGRYDPAEVLLAAWSLEQLPGAEGVVAFAVTAEPRAALNTDYYGDPGDRIVCGDRQLTFRLGGRERHQVGLRAAHHPACIGALDSARGVLALRHTDPQTGLYFNIADNDQPAGPFSAADSYSIFNGGELDFYELETIAPMQVEGGVLAGSGMIAETVLLSGPPAGLRRYLAEAVGVTL